MVEKTDCKIILQNTTILTKIPIQQNTGDFRLLDRQCIAAIKNMRETHRYIAIDYKNVDYFYNIGEKYYRKQRIKTKVVNALEKLGFFDGVFKGRGI